jgi:hypothetical protein
MFKIVKDNKKSTSYESDEYLVKISEQQGFVYKRNGSGYTDYDDNLDIDDFKANEFVKLKITNKTTGKSATKRCYQGFSVIDDIEKDLLGSKKQFKSIFNKIDS